MLSRGFKEQIYDVFKFLPEKVQCALFSATMPLEVLEVTTKFMRDPVRILVKRDELTLEGQSSLLPPVAPRYHFSIRGCSDCKDRVCLALSS